MLFFSQVVYLVLEGRARLFHFNCESFDLSILVDSSLLKCKVKGLDFIVMPLVHGVLLVVNLSLTGSPLGGVLRLTILSFLVELVLSSLVALSKFTLLSRKKILELFELLFMKSVALVVLTGHVVELVTVALLKLLHSTVVLFAKLAQVLGVLSVVLFELIVLGLEISEMFLTFICRVSLELIFSLFPVTDVLVC